MSYFDAAFRCIVDPRQTYFIYGLPFTFGDEYIVTTKEFQGSEINNDYPWRNYEIDLWAHIKKEYKPYHFKVVFTEKQKRRMQ